jgi:hypothetical protein
MRNSAKAAENRGIHVKNLQNSVPALALRAAADGSTPGVR